MVTTMAIPMPAPISISTVRAQACKPSGPSKAPAAWSLISHQAMSAADKSIEMRPDRASRSPRDMGPPGLVWQL